MGASAALHSQASMYLPYNTPCRHTGNCRAEITQFLIRKKTEAEIASSHTASTEFLGKVPSVVLRLFKTHGSVSHHSLEQKLETQAEKTSEGPRERQTPCPCSRF